MLHKGAEIVFVNNSGRYGNNDRVYTDCSSSLGAALISQRQGLLRAFTQLLYNPLCFLIYEDIRVPPNQWKDVIRQPSLSATTAPSLLYFCRSASVLMAIRQ